MTLRRPPLQRQQKLHLCDLKKDEKEINLLENPDAEQKYLTDKAEKRPEQSETPCKSEEDQN